MNPVPFLYLTFHVSFACPFFTYKGYLFNLEISRANILKELYPTVNISLELGIVVIPIAKKPL